MTEFDDRLKAGMSADDEAFLKNLESDDGLFTQMGAAFSGPLRFWVIYAVIMSFVLFCVSVYAVFQAFEADSIKYVIMWVAFALATLQAVGLIKMWFWMRMNHLAVLKELKKIELRLVQLDR